MRLRPIHAHPGRSGAALLMAVLILIVLAAIVFQIFVATNTAARVGRNDVALSSEELAIESALLEVYDKLKVDGESADSGSSGASGGAAGGGAASGGAAGGAGGGGAAGGAGGQSQACDSQRDEWYQPARTEINDIRLRIFAQDEDSKVNVLSLLVRDEKAAKEAFERVVRVLDRCREGTTADIDSRTAEEMVKAMLEYMTKGKKAEIPRAQQISDDAANQDLKLPRSLREFQIVKPFEPNHFRDFRDEHGVRVNSIESFLTVWSALETAGDKPPPPSGTAGSPSNSAGNTGGGTGTGGANNSGNSGNSGSGSQPSGSSNGTGTNQGNSTGGSGSGSGTGSGSGSTAGGSGASGGQNQPAGGSSGGSSVDTGGWQVNLNTAPPAVLKSLFDDREVNPRFWDKVIEYRNLEEEKDESQPSSEPETPAEPVYDEYGREVLQRRIFENLQELEELEGWKDFSSETQARIKSMLTVQSRVFSILVVARRATAAEDQNSFGADPQAMRLAEERGDSLTRVVRSVVWRHKDGEDVKITPLVRWETLDSVPHEVLDYPEDLR